MPSQPLTPNTTINSEVTIYTTKTNRQLGIGKLLVSPDKPPKLEFDEFSGKQKTYRSLICRSREETYTIFDCKVRIFHKYLGGEISFSLLAQGELNTTFTKIFSFVIDDVSAWMPGRWDMSNWSKGADKITRFLNPRKVKVPVSYQDHKFTMSIYSSFIIKNSGKARFEIEEPVIIKLKFTKKIPIKEICQFAIKVKQFFSLLLGYNLTVNRLSVANTDKRLKSTYCRLLQVENPKEIEPYKCLVPHNESIFAHNRWQDIINNFFTNDRFNKQWALFAAYLDHNFFWEHKIFALVAILEAYCNDDLSKNQREKMTFNKKFHRVYDALPQEFIKIIGFNTEHFKKLKKLRDTIAHGNTIDIQDYEITQQYILLNKLSLLLVYFIFRDLGFSDEEIYSFFRRSYHDFVFQSYIDKKSIDKALDDTLFIEVSTKTFDIIANSKNMNFVFEYHFDKSAFIYDEKLSNKIEKKWDKSKKNQSIDKILQVILDTDQYINISYVGGCYIVNGNQSENIGGVIVLNISDEYKRFVERKIML